MEDNVIPTPEATSDTPTNAPTIPQKELIRAALNLPADQFQLGERTFNIHDFEYDDYLLFLSYLTPLIEALAQRMAAKQGVSIPGMELSPSALNPQNILQVCGKILPEMVQIMCKYTDPTITVADVKKLAKNPFVLVTAVMRQIKQNNMVKQFSDFFALTMGMIKSQSLSA